MKWRDAPRTAFIVSCSVVHALSQSSLLSEYRVLFLRFCVPITINRKTALLLFVVWFPHASFSAVVCLCDSSHVYFCGCMCIAVYEFPLKRTRDEIVVFVYSSPLFLAVLTIFGIYQ